MTSLRSFVRQSVETRGADNKVAVMRAAPTYRGRVAQAENDRVRLRPDNEFYAGPCAGVPVEHGGQILKSARLVCRLNYNAIGGAPF